jgi:hypothetical protein
MYVLAFNEPIVQIVFREDFGTDGRGGYFDQYGYVGNNNCCKEVLMLTAFCFKYIYFKLEQWCKISLLYIVNLTEAQLVLISLFFMYSFVYLIMVNLHIHFYSKHFH